MTETEVRAIVAQMLTGADAAASCWAADELQAATEAGITDGSRPLGYVTRQEAAIMAFRAMKAAEEA